MCVPVTELLPTYIDQRIFRHVFVTRHSKNSLQFLFRQAMVKILQIELAAFDD